MGCNMGLEHDPSITYKFVVVSTTTVVGDNSQVEKEFERKPTNVETDDKVITLTAFTSGLERNLDAAEERALYSKTDALMIIVSGDDKQDVVKLSTSYIPKLKEYTAKYHMEAQPIWLVVVSRNHHSAQFSPQLDKIAFDNKWQIKFVENLEQIQRELSNLARILQDLGCKPRARNDIADASRSRHFEASRFEAEFDRPTVAREMKSWHENKPVSTTAANSSGKKDKRASIFDDTEDRILNKKHRLNEQMGKDLMQIQEISLKNSVITREPFKK